MGVEENIGRRAQEASLLLGSTMCQPQISEPIYCPSDGFKLVIDI